MIASKTTEVKFNTRSMNIAYPAGVYDKNVKYECTTRMSPFVEEDGSYYLMNKIGTWLGTETGISPKKTMRSMEMMLHGFIWKNTKPCFWKSFLLISQNWVLLFFWRII